MTESPRKRSRRRNALSVYATTAALFVTVGGFLGVRMANGQDPALGQLGAQRAQVVAAGGPTAGHVNAAGAKPLQTRTSGAAATTPASPNAPATHQTSSVKKKLQTRTSGGHQHGGGESRDA
jgi:hypothetical protein